MSVALPAERLYPVTLRAIAELLRGRGETTGEFDESLRAWEERSDVEAHLRHHVAGMGSMLDWVMASLDDHRGSYKTDHWHEASRSVLLDISWETALMIKAQRGREVPDVEVKPLDATERTERCGHCGFEFVREEDVESVAATAWRKLVVAPAAAEGRGSEIVRQALNYREDEECRGYAHEARAAFVEFGIEIADDLFRYPIFEEPREDQDFDEPVQQIGGDDPCPRCRANEWHQEWVRVTAPQFRVTRGADPNAQMLRWFAAQRRKRRWLRLKSALRRPDGS